MFESKAGRAGFLRTTIFWDVTPFIW